MRCGLPICIAIYLMFQPAITALIQDKENLSLIAWMMVLQFLKLQRAQAPELTAHYWQFDIKLSLAQRIYIKFIHLHAGLGCEFAILPQFADH